MGVRRLPPIHPVNLLTFFDGQRTRAGDILHKYLRPYPAVFPAILQVFSLYPDDPNTAPAMLTPNPYSPYIPAGDKVEHSPAILSANH